MPLETEVKFFITNRESVRKRILETGMVSSGRDFEENIRFEDAENSLIQQKSLLRLRKDKKVRITYKCESTVADSDYKMFEELETEVADFAVMQRILESLGFHSEQRYEKYRESFLSGNTVLCLDTMPFGEFLEIEGEKEDIRAMAGKIGMKWEKRILHNYLAIFERIKISFGLPFSDITFDNFAHTDTDANALISSLEEGC